jgi:presenilin enhancer 2
MVQDLEAAAEPEVSAAGSRGHGGGGRGPGPGGVWRRRVAHARRPPPDPGLARLSPEQKVALCRRYTLLGCGLLPALWAVTACWFWPEAFRKPGFPGQGTIRRLVLSCMLGVLLWAIGLSCWVYIYTTDR